MHRIVVVSFAALHFGCSEPPVPVVATAPILPVNAAPVVAAPPEPATPSLDCTASIVTVTIGGERSTFTKGRELVAGERGATHAYAELVIHKSSWKVFRVEGIAEEGSVSVQILGFDPSIATTGAAPGKVEYTPTGGGHETMIELPIQLAAFGGVGEMIEGTAGPVDVNGQPLEVRFRVCRTADWHVRI